MVEKLIPLLSMLLLDSTQGPVHSNLAKIHLYETMTTVNVAECKRVVGEFRDSQDQPVSDSGTRTVGFSGANVITSKRSDCSNMVNSINVPPGQSQFVFYFQTQQRARLSLELSTNALPVKPLPINSLDVNHYAGTAYYVSTTGDDTNDGSLNTPFRTLLHALTQVSDGDAVFIRAGEYTTVGEGPVVRDRDILIRSMPGETVKLIHQNTNAQYSNLWFFHEQGRVHGLELTGGFYGVKFDGPDSELSNSVIHHVEADGVKIVPGADDAVIWHNEIYRTRQNSSNGQGVDSVNADRLLIEGNYVHDIYDSEGVLADIGMKCKGGGTGCVFRNNVIENVGIGIAIGQSTDGQFFDSVSNPYNYESVDGLAYNNLIRNTRYAGIGFWSALNGKAYNNTLVDVARDGQVGILLARQLDYRNNPPTDKYNQNIRLVNNIVVLHPDSSTAVESIRTNSMEPNNLSLDSRHNLYHDPNRAAIFWDQTDYPNRLTRSYNLPGWLALLNTNGSIESAPNLNANNNHRPNNGSPVLAAGTRIDAFIEDINGQLRDPANPTLGAHEN